MEHFPKWTAFFDKMAARVESESPTEECILQKLIDKMGGEVQLAVEREDHVPLYDHDVVAPLIMNETDKPSAAVRKTLLEKRTNESVQRYLLKPKRVRKGSNGRKALRSQKSQDGANAAAVCQGMEEERVPRVALPKTRVTKKRKHKNDDDDEEEEEIDDQEEELEVQLGEKGGDSDEEEDDLSKYQYLIEKPHYDPDDKAVFKCSAIEKRVA